MSTPFTISGSLVMPPDAGQPVAPIPYSLASQYDAKVVLELNLTGTGTHVVGFGTIATPGAKMLLIEVDASPSGAPINLLVNGGDEVGQIEIAPGGFLALGSPVPVAGIIALSISHTTATKVHVRVLG